MSFQPILAKIAKGPKVSKDLTWEESKQAMKALIEGDATPAQVGAFLIAMRFKMESVTELAAFTAAARQYVAPLPISKDLALVDVPTYAGKHDTFHALVAACIVAASAGAAVLMHGYDGVPGRLGAAGVLKALGVRIDAEAKAVAEEVNQKGFAYLDIGLYHPPVYRFLEMRQELGVRNVFHPIARLLNPARARAQLVGLSHPPHFEKTAEALRMLGSPRALVVRGVEGDPELSASMTTRVLELRDERLTPLGVSPKDFGMSVASSRDMAGFPPDQREKEADLLRRLLHNQVQGGQKDWVLMNAAMVLYAAGKGASLASCLPLARTAIEGGAAARKLEELVQQPIAA
ncbi:anthranilate phosphoribosyltransferase [Nitrospira moscoviensis]|uniref:Anthranilate phosphoribosyltransferase n=1 Tax=Nitrospira moscoviensis TaxID=42253 RepID=A0A0K2G7C8_NITMO|nr:anthranilate phosphoribosyltransferase [Nitrospira moscoviensis]ALA56774.1 Anthranilate phosphoribosyltransferase [Nitrospira moscoviensis]